MPRSRLATALFVFCPVLIGCPANMDTYRLDQLTTLTATPDGPNRLKVRYRPQSESLYYSPGVTLSEHPNHVEVLFVRCAIKEKCPVTHPAKAEAEGVMVVVIPLPSVSVRATDGKQYQELSSGK